MNKNWFITGTSSGLGLGLTERLLARGDSVVATLRKEGGLAQLEQRYPGQLQVVVLDLTRTETIRNAVAQAFDRLGRIDVVVSNAGYGLFGAAEELSDVQIDRQIATNLVGSIQLIRAVLPYLRKQGGGRIMQVSSEGGQITYPGLSLYHASKWGIEGFVESVAKEVAPFGIDFLIAEPGPTGTRFVDGMDWAAPLPCYDDTPAGDIRHAIVTNAFEIVGDAAKTAAAMIAAADEDKPPLRLTLGSTAYDSVRQALGERLLVLEQQKPVSLSVDR